ncbi:MAG: antibiotic biosynthesis monooxygenase [Pseudomonadota bacterium]
MYIAMNRFKVARGSEAEFESVWTGRESHLAEVPGFKEFRLLKGPEAEGHTLYASHSVWATEEAFRDWTRSEAFRAAHAQAGDHKPLYLGPPEFEGFVPVMGADTFGER